MNNRIYKVISRQLWAEAERTGVFRGAPIDLEDGFIHFSSATQVVETVAKHFAGQTDLLLIEVDAGRLGESLRWEVSRGGALFPHLYGHLPLESVISIVELPLEPEGSHRFPANLVPLKPVIVGIGEVLWDIFPDGPRFGGAPANYACHAAGMGARSHMVSAVGRDELGEKALQALADRGVITESIQLNDRPTGAVFIKLDAEGKASYEFLENASWDHLQWSTGLEQLASEASAVCFGTLGQRSDASRQTIRRFVDATPASCLRIFDINLRPPFYVDETILASLEIANILKLNDDELPIVAKLAGIHGTDREITQSLAQRFNLQLVALTRGPHGALLVRSEEVSDHPGISVPVIDTVGAGDAFTAALTQGVLSELELDAINDRATRVAAFVCSQAGATPALAKELLD